MPIRLVLADDHPLIINGLKALLTPEQGFEIVASCANGEDAVKAAHEYRPDILVLDIRLPGKDGLAILKELHDSHLGVKVVLLTAEVSDEQIKQSVRYGAKGVVLKEMAPQLMIQCLRKVSEGGQWLERRSFGSAFEKLLQCEDGLQEVRQKLSDREIEIVKMVARGDSNKRIADQLYISEGTVKQHLHHIYKKLMIEARTQLVRYAQEKGLV